MSPSRPDLANNHGQATVVVCDDLSGACEVAGVLKNAGIVPEVALASPSHKAAIAVVDIDTRGRCPEAARSAVAGAMRNWRVSYLKIDSLVRGPVKAMVQAAAGGDRPVLFCPALPSLGRTIADGEFLLDGARLATTDAWKLEPTGAPTSVSDLLGPAVELFDPVAGPNPDARICYADASSESDLDRLADACVRHRMLPVGSAGMLQALLRRSVIGVPSSAVDVEAFAPRLVIVVVGSASAAAGRQVAELALRGFPVLELDPAERDDDNLARAQALLGRDQSFALHWRSASNPDPSRSDELTRRLATMLASLAADDADIGLVLIGGTTARSVANALGTNSLIPIETVSHGSVVMLAENSRVMAIRPGSFGTTTSLAELISAIESISRKKSHP